MVEDRWVQRGVLKALYPLSIHVTFTAIVAGAYPGRPKCAVAKCLCRKTTYRRDSPEVAKLCVKTRQIKLMLKIVSIHIDHVDACWRASVTDPGFPNVGAKDEVERRRREDWGAENAEGVGWKCFDFSSEK